MAVPAHIRHRTRQSHPRHISRIGDRWLIVLVSVLCLIGILMVYDSSVAIGIRDFHDPYHFAREQLKWLILGLGAFCFFSRFSYERLKDFAIPILIGTLCLLIAVFVPGLGVHALGARRWINFRLFILQPAELAKLAMIIYLSAWFSKADKGKFFSFLLIIGMVAGLIILEPDLGTTIILLATSVILYFLSGAPLVQFMALIPVFGVAIGALAIFEPYRMQRILTFLNPEQDPLGASYQIRQILLSLGSGGLWGIGLGKSRQKYEYLPEANTDSIFAILGEETGFIGAGLVILLFIFLIWRCFKIARRSSDSFGKFLALGIGSWVGFQTIVNIGAMVALFPLTGVPLPLISYGGSNLVITLGALGIVHNISKKRS